MITIGVVQFPGSNCERETILTIERCGMQAKELLWNAVSTEFDACHGFVVVGGFSYEDRSRSGVIAAMDPVMDILKQQDQQGKPILGICNGAQILVESGLVPGLQDYTVGMALTENKRIKNGAVLGTGFYNAWVCLKRSATSRPNAFNQQVKTNQVLHMPAAHAEGRFVMPEKLFNLLKERGQIAYIYCDSEGEAHDEFPVNPNGSMGNIAAVTNPDGNVMAMMPHPERTEDCDSLFLSMKDYIENCDKPKAHQIDFKLKPFKIQVFEKPAQQCFVKLIITDNHAATVENALRQAGISVKVQREIHWSFSADSAELGKIMQSGELFNSNKELSSEKSHVQSDAAFLVREIENTRGLQKQQTLNHHFSVESLADLKHGIVWHLSFDENAEENKKKVLDSGVLFNHFAHEVFEL